MHRLFLALTCVLFPWSAVAKPKVVLFPVVAIPGECELSTAGEMTKSLVEEMRSQKGFDLVVGEDPSAAVSAPETGRAPARSDANYRAALTQLQDGAEQMKKLRLPQAIRALEQGIDGVTKNLEMLDDYDRLIDAYLLLAVAHFRKGKEAAGADVLEQLARLRPDYELDASKYPPIFVSVFDKARARALERERGSLKVTSAPAAAEVFLNGRSVGKTPLVVDEVIPGANHLVVRQGERAWSKVVDVRANEATEAHANLGAGGPDAPMTLGDAIAANRFDRETRQAARQKGRDGGADFVVVLAMGRGNGVFALGGFLGNAKTGKWLALSPVAPDYDMLSASIEAHSLAREVGQKVEGFSGDLGPDTVPFIAGKSVQAAKRSGALAEQRVAFVGGVVKVSGAAPSGRRPVASREPEPEPPTPPEAPAAPEPPAAKPKKINPEDVDLDAEIAAEIGGHGAASRAPVVSSNAPKTPRPKAGENLDEPELSPGPRRGREPVTAGRRPVGASTANPDVDLPALAAPPPKAKEEAPGPVVSGTVGIEIDDGEATAPHEEIAAVSPEMGSGPLAVRDLDKDAGTGGSIFETWWFWTAVGAGVVLIAGGTYLAVHDTSPSSVRVYAVW